MNSNTGAEGRKEWTKEERKKEGKDKCQKIRRKKIKE